MTNLKYFEVGQTVYHGEFGKGLVTSVNYEHYRPIGVTFEHGRESFTFDGRLEEDKPVSLSQNPVPEIVNQPICPFKEGDLVWVRDGNSDIWSLRFFKEFFSDRVRFPYRTYFGGRIGGADFLDWDECEPYDPATVKNYRFA